MAINLSLYCKLKQTLTIILLIIYRKWGKGHRSFFNHTKNGDRKHLELARQKKLLWSVSSNTTRQDLPVTFASLREDAPENWITKEIDGVLLGHVQLPCH